MKPEIERAVDWPWLEGILACPACHGALARTGATGDRGTFACSACGLDFTPNADTRSLDFRRSRQSTLTFQTGIGRYAELWNRVPKDPPAITFHGHVPSRASRHFVSVLKDRISPGGSVIDLGCGAGDHRGPVQSIGMRYVGLDYGHAGADLFADAHALPLRDAAADAVIMHALSQALENPFVGFAEAVRVLKPGGWLLGTADSGATFADSFFNMTPWGVLSVLGAQGVSVERMWLTKDALLYFGTNPGYPRVIRSILRALSRVAKVSWLTPRRAMSGTPRDEFITAGSLAFIGRKPPAPRH